MKDALDTALLNDFQRDFPLCTRPFEAMAESLGVPEAVVLARFQALCAQGKVSRIGPVFSPRRVGASTLVAMAVPQDALNTVAAQVNLFPGVNHNYEREHRFNLWFVLTAPDEAMLQEELGEIRRVTGFDVLPLPMLEAFHIDLGFCLQGKPAGQRVAAHSTLPPLGQTDELNAEARALVAALQGGIPLISQPYAAIADQIGQTESRVRVRIEQWIAAGIIKRFGVVVRHHELGFSANAMLVHNIPDARVSEIGERLAGEPAVTLCYRRPRRLPEWPHNLFCMIHGRERASVLAAITRLRAEHGLDAYDHEILFSKTRFKQVGARYA